MRRLLALLFALALPAAAAPVTVALYGDSTNEGIDGATRKLATVTPAHALQRLFDARFGTGRVLVLARAVSGTTSADLAAMPEGDIAVVNFGINDARLGVPLDSYRANLARLVRPGVVFKTPSPVHGRPYPVEAHAAAMREVATKIGAPVIDAHAFTVSRSDWHRMVPDGAHPTADLYALVAAASMPVLVPMVERLLALRGFHSADFAVAVAEPAHRRQLGDRLLLEKRREAQRWPAHLSRHGLRAVLRQ